MQRARGREIEQRGDRPGKELAQIPHRLLDGPLVAAVARQPRDEVGDLLEVGAHVWAARVAVLGRMDGQRIAEPFA